ncbi:MAG TPA: RsmE family RNA methyltransferase [Candidatus Hydrogenedentes bacterium]|nr:RsmE family RNA methyltransferase [Candidatus Hydrogenedentota bacterium]
MPHVHRFYIPEMPDATTEWPLPSEEAHHALHVVRVRAGDPLVVFDGRGREWPGVVGEVARREVTVRVGEARLVPPPRTRLIVVQAWLNRDKSVETLIRRCTELGVSHFLFFRSGRSDRPPKPSDKWTRLAAETCKQCGRAWLPTFDVADDLDAALALAEVPVLVAAMDCEPIPLSEALVPCAGACSILVGPEGDFADAELRRALDSGAMPISLGHITYRSEVAACTLAALVLYERGELGPR